MRYQLLHRRGHPLTTQIWEEDAGRFLWSNGPWIADDSGLPTPCFTQDGRLIMAPEGAAAPADDSDAAFLADHEQVDDTVA